MEKNVITITRQFGSLGRPIAKAVAKKLGFAYYDRDIIETAAERLGKPVGSLAEYDGHIATSYDKMAFPLGFGTLEMQNKVFEIEKEIICEFAKKENCVIVGRCSDYVLQKAGFQNILSVFIYAPYNARYNYCLNYLGFAEEAVEKYIEMIDKSRSGFYRKYTGEKFESLLYRHLMVDSSSMPIEQVSDLICAAAKLKFDLEKF